MLKVFNWIISKKIFIVRSIIFFSMLSVLLFGKEIATDIFMYEIMFKIKVFHLLWGFLMLEMVLVLIPSLDHFTGCGKIYKRNYMPKKYDLDDLNKQLNKINKKAVYVLLIWILFLLVLRKLNVSDYYLIIIVISLYYLDQVFVNIWCPFKHIILKNKCCASCRIYNWGFPMLVSPLIFIESFYSYSLIFVSLIVLIQWENLFKKYPERFSEISNERLKCINCTDKCKKMKKRSV